MNKNIIMIIYLMIIPMVLALPSGTVYKDEPVLLAEGWNGVGIVTNYSTLVQGDFNVSLVNDSGTGELNLLGMSFMTPNGKCISLDSLTFWNSNDDSFNYEDAKTNNWIEPIEFTENLDTTGEVEEFMKLCPYEAIWVKSYLAINMTVSDVYGSPIGETYDWAKLRFSNGTDDLGIVEAGTEGWLSSTTLQTWNQTGSFLGNPTYGWIFIDNEGIPLHTNILASWRGYFVNSLEDNIYLLTNNETKRNVIKVKCNAKFIGSDGVCKMPSGKAKYVGANKVFKFKSWSSHIIRLIGSLRNTKG